MRIVREHHTLRELQMAANDTQEGGNHYSKFGALQHWDIVHHFKLDYFQGQITKYVLRWKDKGGIQDLKKAQHFLQKYIELQEAEAEQKVGIPQQSKEMK
jgi:hypothetical protein